MDIKKRLRPFTIIPEDLYINRDADRQLNTIIDEMGRPGYVLVARQMGKTNLLLSAKQRLENKSNVFLYIDLSNKFQDIRTCFRNIIDTAIRSYPNIFSSGGIDRSLSGDLPPHIEHEQELIYLLDHIKEKLVIILDEIDALMNVSFSDELFAQIRSIYFSRVNTEQFKRLTYILSGVAEPSEIIKNKNISPFNIGEKIYLDDFSYNEFVNFLEKAHLNFSKEVNDRIFYWCSGNPRMTWDLCSAIEDNLIAGEMISEALIDETVKHLYLTDFDRPPIDHIRKLCEDSREIRNAVIAIKKGQSSDIDSNLRKKLYLSGMIGSDISNKEVLLLKNKIIDDALSVTWLGEIEKSIVGLVKLGSEYYDNYQYAKAVEIFVEYLNETNTPDPVVYGRLAYSYFYTKNYDEASNFFKLAIEHDPTYQEYSFLKDGINYHLGLCNYYTSKLSECIDLFKLVIDTNQSKFKYLAMLNLSGAYSKLDFEKYADEITRLCTQIVQDVSEVDSNENQYIKTIAYVNLANIFLRVKKDEVKALEYYLLAETIADTRSLPVVLSTLLNRLTLDEKLKKTYLDRIISHILDNKLPINEDLSRPLDLAESSLIEILYQAFQIDEAQFERLLNYAVDNKLTDSDFNAYLYDLILYSVKINTDTTIKLIKRLIPDPEIANFNDLRVAYSLKILVAITKPKEFPELENLYFKSVEEDNEVETADIDAHAFMARISNELKLNNLTEAISLIEKINKKRSSPGLETNNHFAVIDFLELQVLFVEESYERVKSKGRDLLAYIDRLFSEKFEDAFLDKDDLTNLKKNTLEVLRATEYKILLTNKIPDFRPSPKIGRNSQITVKYKDGKIIKAKYKKLESDLNRGLCELVDHE